MIYVINMPNIVLQNKESIKLLKQGGKGFRFNSMSCTCSQFRRLGQRSGFKDQEYGYKNMCGIHLRHFIYRLVYIYIGVKL